MGMARPGLAPEQIASGQRRGQNAVSMQERGPTAGTRVREALGRKQWLLHDTPVSMLMAMAAAAPTVVLMKLTNSLVSHGQPSLPCAVAPMSDST